MQPERLGPYRIVRTLGRGGMGAVYKAVNLETDQLAAVKILSASLAEDEDFRQRFEAEIETLRKLRHPNIVRLFGFGEQDGQLFFAMELVEGNSLEQELQNGRCFDWREVAQIGIGTCRALRHAHDRGVIHRDIKPANLLLVPDGQIKLSDFGIARLFGYSRLTAAGNVLGTVEYIAPEQAGDQPIGPSADLYSLGAVMFALLARRPPFRARSLPGLLEMQRSRRPEPVRRYAPSVPTELEDVIAQLLEKDPRKRFATATALSRHLEAMIHGLSLREQAIGTAGDDKVKADVDLSRTATTLDRPDINDLPETCVLEQEPDRPPAQDGPAVDQQQLAETKETSAFAGLVEAAAAPEEADQQQKTSDRFVAVEEEDLDRFEAHEPAPGALISLQTWLLAVALVVLGVSAWYLLQEPSADALYERIVATTADNTISSYRQAEDDIQKFMKYHSSDPRARQLLKYLDEIELDRLERKFELRARGLVDTGRLLPIERDYLEAIKYVRLDTDLGMAKLQALVDLYNHRDDVSGPTGQCLALAKRRLKQLRLQRQSATSDHLALLLERLDYADEISSTDKDRARQIRRAVIELYQHKPWAAEAVQRAQESLDVQAGSR